MATCKNNSSMIRNIDPVLSKVLCRYTFNMNKASEINLKAILLSQIVIGRLF